MLKFVPRAKEIDSSDGKEIDLSSCIISRFINPGGFFFHESNCQIHTILGSCIAITLWHPILNIGGMCHFVLPSNRKLNYAGALENQYDGRYSGGAMALFEREAAKHRTNLREYQAKIFGGSNMLANPTLKEDELIGTKNTEAALMLLSEREIPLIVADVGETGFRRIIFDVEKGDVWVKHRPLRKNIPQQRNLLKGL